MAKNEQIVAKLLEDIATQELVLSGLKDAVLTAQSDARHGKSKLVKLYERLAVESRTAASVSIAKP